MPLPNLAAPDGGQSAELAVRLNRSLVAYCHEIGAKDVDVRLLIEASAVVLVGYLSRLDKVESFMLEMHLIKLIGDNLHKPDAAAS